ncbi:hypothetical protein ACFYNO_39510 [Kitasatospora sp. NPDC006697]|uniref:hypothetical protein n=1 Tax=Kitasatospora sp. NPDC006697 TaxID=3364020 RepID=UPI0036A95033
MSEQQPPWQQPPGQPPPPAGWGPPPGPPPRPKRQFGRGVLFGCLGAVLLVVVVIVIVVVAVGGDKPSHPPAGDVAITACSVDESTRVPSAKLEIVNHSSKSSNYAISVEFLDDHGTRVAEGAALETGVAPGQKVEDSAGGTAQVNGAVTCKVNSVNRVSATG